MQGVRVMRGKDWTDDDQDGGEGHVGTAEIKARSERTAHDDGVVNVKWDIGNKGDYRAGYEEKYALRIYDNGTAGVLHDRTECCGCRERPIKGILWICAQCMDVFLCSKCYHNDSHNTAHDFYRKTDADTKVEDVGARTYIRKITAKGLFVGAAVIAGFDRPQDDDEGKIVAIISGTSFNSFAKVEWEDAGKTSDHSIAHGSKLELMCADDEGTPGPSVYIDHLPHLDTSTGDAQASVADALKSMNLDEAFASLLKSLKPTTKRKPCKYMDRCEMFLKSLAISKEFFDKERNICYCRTCFTCRKEKKVIEVGQPKQKYVLPVGWSSFGLQPPPHARAQGASDKWHRAFHGTPPFNVGKILKTGELLMPSDVTPDGVQLRPPDGHFTEDRKPRGFDIKKIFLSPSILYSGCGAYATAIKYNDPQTRKTCYAKTVFEVLLRPGTYDKGPETVGAGRRVIDPEYSNGELEWMTKRRGVVIPIALLICLE